MPITPNLTKQRLAAGKVAFGFQVRFVRSTEIARAAAAAGYHYLFIDLEHSTMELDTAAHICAAGLDAGVTPIVRVPGHEHHHATRILEGGAQGIIFPHVATAEAAREAVRNCRFPPLGQRSHSGSLVHMGWEPMPVADLARTLNDNLLLIALVESAEALENIDEIAGVDGIDLISVGSNDLALDLGVPGDYGHPKMRAAYDRIIAATKKHNKFLRIGGVYDMEAMRENIAQGSRLMTVTSDVKLLMNGMRAQLKDLKGRIDPSLCD